MIVNRMNDKLLDELVCVRMDEIFLKDRTDTVFGAKRISKGYTAVEV